MNNVKKDANLTLTTGGTLKLAKSQKVEPTQISNEIQIRYCLVRRGLALEQANILDFKKHDELIELLMEARMQEPVPGYQRISLKQLELADKNSLHYWGRKPEEVSKRNLLVARMMKPSPKCSTHLRCATYYNQGLRKLFQIRAN